MGLRPYQQEALAAIAAADREGCRAQLITLPTGTGKTRIASNVPTAIDMQPWESMAFIVAQEELAYQALDDLQMSNPELIVTLEKAEHHGNENADIVVASVDTLSRSPARLAKYAQIDFRAIFLDEAHGAVSQKYLNVLRELRVLKGDPNRDPGRLLAGLTATPRRHDAVALELLFDRIVYKKSIREMVDAGWIAKTVAYRVDTGVDLDSVDVRQRDFATGDLSRAMNTSETNALVVQKHMEYGAGLPAICFTVDIAHSEDLAATFRHHGLAFEAISSNTPKARRKELVEAHRNMWIDGLCSCQALLVGFDSPPATIAHWVRPTMSSLLFVQGVGRVARPYPAPEAAATHTGYVKKHAILVDYVGVSSKHRLYNAATLWGLSPRFDFEGRSVSDVQKEVEEIQDANPTLDLTQYASLEEIKAAVTQVDLWKPAPIPKLARSCSLFTWMQMNEDLYRLAAPGMAVYLQANHLGQYEVWRRMDDGTEDRKMIMSEPEDAFAYADALIPDESVRLLLAKSRWRNDPPTEAQCGLAWRKDPTLRRKFASAEAFYRFASYHFEKGNKAFSKGALSTRIEMVKAARAHGGDRVTTTH